MHNQTKSQEANRLIVASYPEGLLNEVLYGKSPPRGSDPSPLCIPFTPFVYLLLINGTPSFSYLVYNFASLLTVVNSLSLLNMTFRQARGRGGALGYFWGGYVPPGTPNWHPVLKKISPKTDTPF